MTIFHTELEARWPNLTIFEQMANIGAEVGRAGKWKDQNKIEMSKKALYRALELIDFSLADPKNLDRCQEICRLRELLIDHILFENIYGSTTNWWDKYFYGFTIAARTATNS